MNFEYYNYYYELDIGLYNVNNRLFELNDEVCELDFVKRTE